MIEHCRTTKLFCVFFELLLDVFGSKHDSNRLLLITLNNDCLIRFQQLNTRCFPYFIKCTRKSYFCGCCVLKSMLMIGLLFFILKIIVVDPFFVNYNLI